jgi:predicted nucleotidyltransferase
MNDFEELLPALEGASFALVFGSFGTERFGPESDIDLAAAMVGFHNVAVHDRASSRPSWVVFALALPRRV